MTIEIRNRNGKVLWVVEADTLLGADLSDADLSGADLSDADLSGADLLGAKLNWSSHDIIAELLKRHSGENIDRLKLAGLVLMRRQWCWDDFMRLNDPQMSWALETLSHYIVEGDNSPDVLLEAKAKLQTAVVPV